MNVDEERPTRLLRRKGVLFILRRNGERKGRLLRGHNHAEKLLLQNIWMPLFGSLENLHPEYEVYDWNRKSQIAISRFCLLPSIWPFRNRMRRLSESCEGFGQGRIQLRIKLRYHCTIYTVSDLKSTSHKKREPFSSR
jgi:hypothetical protein